MFMEISTCAEVTNYISMLNKDEKIIKLFKPDLLRRIFNFLRKKVALVITNQRVICCGNFLNKEIKVQEIGDTFVTDGGNLDILKRGTPPTDESLVGELLYNDTLAPIYKGYISVSWLSASERKEALETIKNLIK